MKKFGRNILSFTLLLISVFLLTELFLIYQIKSISWKLPETTNVLFMGASHICNGINPVHYPNSANLAKESEKYLYTYLKLKQVVKANPQQIDTLYLEFAPTDTWKGTDYKYLRDIELNEYFQKFHPFFSRREFDIFLKSPSEFIAAYKNYIPSLSQIITGFHLKDLGGYKGLDNIYVPKDESYVPIQTNASNDINIGYLNLIIEFCNDNNIKIILLHMPVCHSNYCCDVDAYYKFYNKNYSSISLLDYSNLQLSDSLRSDRHHLNYMGAKVFTQRLFEELNKVQ